MCAKLHIEVTLLKSKYYDIDTVALTAVKYD